MSIDFSDSAVLVLVFIAGMLIFIAGVIVVVNSLDEVPMDGKATVPPASEPAPPAPETFCSGDDDDEDADWWKKEK